MEKGLGLISQGAVLLLSDLWPCVAALALAASVITISTSYVGYQKLLFTTRTFAIGFSVSVILVINEQEQLRVFWSAFNALPNPIKFILSVAVITGTYFGGALYLANIYSATGGGGETPASCDQAMEFEVPAELPEDDKELFEECLTKFTDELVADMPTVYEMPSEAVEWVHRMVNYTVAGGKMNRGLAVMAVQKILAESKGQKLSGKERVQSAALGWCIEFLQAFFLVADDVMDDSVTRRGQPCWYRLPEVKLIAINDSFILESFVYKILKRYFGKESFYPQLVDLFLETTRQTEFGQLLDLTSTPLDGKVDLSRYTIERYTSIVKYKTAFYSFYAPVALGMIVSGVTDRNLFEKAREILCLMGEYFQVQDDYLDCYGTPEQIGKIGTDIQDAKCGWLVVQALDRVNSKQRKTLEQNYGKNDEKCVQVVKNLYRTLDLESVYQEYEEESYIRIKKMLDETKGLPRGVFEFLLQKIYKRSK